MKPVPQDAEAAIIKGASTPAPAHTFAKWLDMQGSSAQLLQPGARLVARSEQDFQSELRLAAILSISERDARSARAASHPLEDGDEDERDKPADPQLMARRSSNVGHGTPACKDQGQRHLGKAASSSSIDTYEWQDIELKENTACNGDGHDSQNLGWQGVGITVSTVCTASLVERGGGDIGHLKARAQPSAHAKMSAMQAKAAAAAAARRAKDRQAAAHQAVFTGSQGKVQPSGWWLGSEALGWVRGPSGAKADLQSAVPEKFYGHLLPSEGVEEMLSVFSEEADT